MKTQVLPITPESVALAARLLQQGELVALPTETSTALPPTPATARPSRKF